MKKGTDNFGKKNIESIDRFIKEEPASQAFGMFANESAGDVAADIREESRRRCAKALCR